MVGVRDETMRTIQELYENTNRSKYLSKQLRKNMQNMLGNFASRPANVNFVNRPRNVVNRLTKRVSKESRNLNKHVNSVENNTNTWLNMRNYANHLMRLNKNLKNLEKIIKVQKMRIKKSAAK